MKGPVWCDHTAGAGDGQNQKEESSEGQMGSKWQHLLGAVTRGFLHSRETRERLAVKREKRKGRLCWSIAEQS